MPQLILSSYINYFFVLGLFFYSFYSTLQSSLIDEESDFFLLATWKLYYTSTVNFLILIEKQNLRSLKIANFVDSKLIK